MGGAILAETMTVQRLVAERQAAAGGRGRELWIVDEASLVGSRTMRRLLDRANTRAARVVLVGDVRQLGSVEAGRAFGQLQEAGLKTFVLDEIVRQTNPRTREAVEAAIGADAARALERLQAGGGAVIEIAASRSPGESREEARERARRERHEQITAAYARLDPEQRARTIVIDPRATAATLSTAPSAPPCASAAR